MVDMRVVDEVNRITGQGAKVVAHDGPVVLGWRVVKRDSTLIVASSM